MYVTADEYAAIVKMHPVTVRKLSREGKLACAEKIGGSWRYRIDEKEAPINRCNGDGHAKPEGGFTYES